MRAVVSTSEAETSHEMIRQFTTYDREILMDTGSKVRLS